MMTITVELTWNTLFETKEEYDEFVKEIANIHTRRYGTNVAEEPLLNSDYYEGARNFIAVNHSDFSGSTSNELKVGDYVKNSTSTT